MKTLKKNENSRRSWAMFWPVLVAAVLAVGNLHAAIAQRGSATTASNSGNTLTIARPAGVVVGDVMIAVIAQYNSSGTPAAASLSGWTVIKSGTLGGSSSRYGTVLYKVAGSSEPSSYAFALTSTVGGAVGDIVAFYGEDSATPLDVAVASLPSFTSSTTANVTATTIITATANAAVVMFGMAATTSSGTGGTWSGWSAGLTEILDHQGSGTANSAASVGAAWKTLATAGTTGAGAATLSASMRNGGIWVALKALTAPANAANSTVSASPASVIADGITTSTVTVTLLDGSSSPVASKTVTLASSRGAADTISAASGFSSASGVVTFTVKSATAGSPVFTATDASDGFAVTQTASVTFTPVPPASATLSSVSAFPSSVSADGATTSMITVTLLDAGGNPTPAKTVTLASSRGAADTISAASGLSSATGVVTFTVRSSTPGSSTYTATDATDAVLVNQTAGVTFVASSAKDILTFGPGAIISGTNIAWNVANGTAVTSLSPTYTVSAFASGSPTSGTARNFSTPQIYTVTAQDGSTKIYLVSVAVSLPPQTYGISVDTDLAQEFSPFNKSGHPVVTGLDNYSNSIVVGGRRGLLATAMKAPWNVNIGQQTMLCSDCHDTTTTNYDPAAAQGPHGSATQFILRGPNGANWPNVTLANISSSWCMNCHLNSAGVSHTEGNHSSSQCYVCHTVVPHGGKVSRLIAVNTGGMPARYAWNNAVANVGMSSILKAATGSYSENGNCRTTCGHHGSGPINETW